MRAHRRLALAVSIALCALAALPGAAPAAPGTVWLCRPGLADNPCRGGGATELRLADGTTRTVRPPARGRPKVDCFYVYPTVSGQPTLNANRRIEDAQRGVAGLQAAGFSRRCRVWAPMYRQVTVKGLYGGGFTRERLTIGYRDVAAAWRDYLRNHNDGRGVVLIGHSQGTGMLTRLVSEQIDRRPRQRRLLVSALLIGGGVTVREGSDRGGDFRRVPACRSATQTGCVIAYNTYLTAPLNGGIFGRPGLFAGGATGRRVEVLCTNPAALAGGGGRLLLQQPGGPGFVAYPGLYEGRCREGNGYRWLQATDVGAASDTRPRLAESLGPAWGLHLFDVNIALGNLERLVGRQSAAWLRKNG